MNWNRALVTIERFERIASALLRELEQYRVEITTSQSTGDSYQCTSAKINAKRVVDQLLSGLQQVLALRNELSPIDQQHFDAEIEPTRLAIQQKVNKLNAVCIVLPTLPSESMTTSLPTPSSQVQLQQQRHRVDDLRLRAESARENADATLKLSQDIDELNQIMIEMAALVQNQHETVDSIEEHVEKAEQNIRSGNRDVKRAVGYQSTKYPLAAAVVGSIAFGGPVGVIAGSAVAGVCAAVGGAFAGLYGGRALKRQMNADANSSSSTS